MQWLDGDDVDEIELTLKSMISPPFHGLPEFSPFTESGARFHSRCESGLRAMITLMCRSQLPLKKMPMGFGGGKRMVKRATADVEDSLKLRCKAGPEIVHQEEIPHFWSSELRRLGWDHTSVPIVKLH